jgi:vacuolar-type H+-ATPase subunit H
MAESSLHESDDERLKQLLDVERRLQDLVQAARDNAARRIADARAASERRLAASQDEAARADAERARSDRALHEEALSAIQSAHRASLDVITGIPDKRVDELARLALTRVIAGTGEPA